MRGAKARRVGEVFFRGSDRVEGAVENAAWEDEILRRSVQDACAAESHLQSDVERGIEREVGL